MISGKPDGEPAGQKNCKREKIISRVNDHILPDTSMDTAVKSSSHLALITNKFSQN